MPLITSLVTSVLPYFVPLSISRVRGVADCEGHGMAYWTPSTFAGQRCKEKDTAGPGRQLSSRADSAHPEGQGIRLAHHSTPQRKCSKFANTVLTALHPTQILKDEETLAEANIVEDTFMVVMVSKVSLFPRRDVIIPDIEQWVVNCLFCASLGLAAVTKRHLISQA